MRLLAEGLGSMRGGRTLFQGLSFALHAGESLVVAGPNGSGKTTLLRLIAGLLPPTAGRITLADSEDPVGESVHFVGHLDALKGALTLGENLAFYRSLFGGGGDAVNAALGRMGIGTLAMLPAEVLSAGEGGGGARPWRGSLSRIGRSGSSTSRPTRSTPTGKYWSRD